MSASQLYIGDRLGLYAALRDLCAGSGGDGTLLNAGSAGTMERVQSKDGGITFGNQATGLPPPPPPP